jgi:hypothetical protein
MSKIRLGASAHESEIGKRDAFHAPGCVVYCQSDLEPGASVQFHTWSEVVPCDAHQRQAIVDPFLHDTIKAGRPFWVLFQPDLIEELTHNFRVTGVPDVPAGDVPGYLQDWQDECRNCG